MVSTVTDRQAAAFRESVQEGPPVGGASYPDAVAKAQDLIDFGIVIASRYVAAAEPIRTSATLPPDTAADLAANVRKTMGAMVQVQRLMRSPVFEAAPLTRKDEFDDAVVDLRELIADLWGAAAGVTPPPPPSDAERDRLHDEFVRLAEVHRPPQSWFEEDFTALAGPGGP